MNESIWEGIRAGGHHEPAPISAHKNQKPSFQKQENQHQT
jgi:hypothetical protein